MPIPMKLTSTPVVVAATESEPRTPARKPDRTDHPSPAAPPQMTNDTNGPSTSTATPTKPRPARPTPTPLPRWQVLLHNDDVNSMDYVVEVLERIGRLLRPAATRCMMEAHLRGVGIVVTTHRERAEFLADQFRSLRLVVTIEPVR